MVTKNKSRYAPPSSEGGAPSSSSRWWDSFAADASMAMAKMRSEQTTAGGGSLGSLVSEEETFDYDTTDDETIESVGRANKVVAAPKRSKKRRGRKAAGRGRTTASSADKYEHDERDDRDEGAAAAAVQSGVAPASSNGTATVDDDETQDDETRDDSSTILSDGESTTKMMMMMKEKFQGQGQGQAVKKGGLKLLSIIARSSTKCIMNIEGAAFGGMEDYSYDEDYDDGDYSTVYHGESSVASSTYYDGGESQGESRVGSSDSGEGRTNVQSSARNKRDDLLLSVSVDDDDSVGMTSFDEELTLSPREEKSNRSRSSSKKILFDLAKKLHKCDHRDNIVSIYSRGEEVTEEDFQRASLRDAVTEKDGDLAEEVSTTPVQVSRALYRESSMQKQVRHVLACGGYPTEGDLEGDVSDEEDASDDDDEAKENISTELQKDDELSKVLGVTPSDSQEIFHFKFTPEKGAKKEISSEDDHDKEEEELLEDGELTPVMKTSRFARVASRIPLGAMASSQSRMGSRIPRVPSTQGIGSGTRNIASRMSSKISRTSAAAANSGMVMDGERSEEEGRKAEARRIADEHKLRKAEEKMAASVARSEAKRLEAETRRIVAEQRLNEAREEKVAASAAKSEAKRLEAETRRILAEQKLNEAREARAAAVANAETRRLEAEARRIGAERMKREAEEKMAALVAASEKARLEAEVKKAAAEQKFVYAERSRNQSDWGPCVEPLTVEVPASGVDVVPEVLAEKDQTMSPGAAMMHKARQGLSRAGRSFLTMKRPERPGMPEAYYVPDKLSGQSCVTEDSMEIVPFGPRSARSFVGSSQAMEGTVKSKGHLAAV